MEHKISVIVPVYNTQKYLERCVESIRNQSYRNLEIILVDDGSPDESGRMCDELALKDERISVIHKPNGGLSDARNKGVDQASADYIMFTDSDDFLHPDMVRDLMDRMYEHNADIVQCSFRSVTDDTMVDPGGDEGEMILTNLEALEYIYTPYGVDYVMACNKLYRKELFNTIRFPLSKIHEDEFTTWKLFYHAGKIIVTGKKYYYYYQSPNSIIRSGFSEKKLHYAEAMEERIAFFREKGLDHFYSLAIKRYARWLLLFMYRNRKALRGVPAIKKDLILRYAKVEKLVRMDPSTSVRLRVVLRNALALDPLIGFLVYQNLFRRNIIGRIAGFLGLDF